MFSIIKHPFKHSIYYNLYISIYIINSKNLFIFNNIVLVIYKDIILIKNIFIAVNCKGKKVIEKMIYGPNSENIRNLMLKDMVFVLNFYTNIVVANLFYKQGYWFYHLDNILRYRQSLTKNVVVIDIKIIYSLFVIKYKSSVSFCFFVLSTV